MKQHRQLSIVGRGSGFRDVEYDSEVWAVSTVAKSLQRYDKVFQIHESALFEPWLKDVQNKVVLMSDKSRLPEALLMPCKELNEIFGKIFHSSIAWMFGLGMYMGYTKIALYGVNMEHGTEYGAQRDSMFYLIGYAKAKGIEVIIPKTSGLYLPKKNYQE